MTMIPFLSPSLWHFLFIFQEKNNRPYLGVLLLLEKSGRGFCFVIQIFNWSPFLPPRTSLKTNMTLENHPMFNRKYIDWFMVDFPASHVSKWLRTIVNKSPKDRVVGPLPNGRTPWLKNGACLTTFKSWDNSPSNQLRLVAYPIIYMVL